MAELATMFSTDIDSGQNTIILIDGNSGSGKTTFAQQLEGAIFSRTKLKPQLIHMDDLYPGWEGLRAGARILVSDILEPLSRGSEAEYQKWNWVTCARGEHREPGNGWRTVSPLAPLIVEGCGAVSRESRRLAQHAVWIHASLEDRLSRLSARDEGAFGAFQELWSAQETEFYNGEGTLLLCDYRVAN